MYNLIVHGNNTAYDGDPIILDISRCIREYTDDDISQQYSLLGDEQINKIRRFPTVFAYEQGTRKDPKFGLINDITIRQSKVKIEYEIIELNTFISADKIDSLNFELDIHGWEMNRTHWAIKNINLGKELYSKGIVLPAWTMSESKKVDIAKHFFDVALSFPGEVREYVCEVSKELESLIGPNAYFYDDNYTAQLARPSLDTLLQDIYKNRSRLIVVFLGSQYQGKPWCGIEFHAIREILLARENNKIMYVRMDDGEVDGVFKTDGYVDSRKTCAADLAKMIKERIDILIEET